MKAVFIAGTDTEVGKTVVTGLLARYLLEKRYKTVTQKWVQTGSRGFSQDIDAHLKLMKKKKIEFKNYLPLMVPYSFSFASSPHLAARLDRKRININKIKRSLFCLAKNFDAVIVEGSGGLLVPLNKNSLLIDVVKDLRLPVILVVENRIGAINHTLLSIEALKSRNIKIVGLIFNNTSKNNAAPTLHDNPQIVKALTGIEILGILPYAPNNINLICRHFKSIGNKVIDKLWKI